MSNRSASFASVIVASILAGTTFSAIAQNAPKAGDKAVNTKVADSCLSRPKGGAIPAGRHWYYRIDRATKRQCWYLGEEKNKMARAAPTQQDSSASAVEPDRTPPQQSQNIPVSIADACAELPSPQASMVQNSTGSIAQPTDSAVIDSREPVAPDANAEPSAISSRELDSSSIVSSTKTQLAAAEPPASLPTTVAEAPRAVIPGSPANAGSPLDKQSPSTQLLLMVMVGAVALAGLFSAAIMRFSRTPVLSDEIRHRRAAPWDSILRDSIHGERLSPPIFPFGEAPLQRREAPLRHMAPSRDPRAADDPDRRVAEMLARLARSAQT